MKVTSKYLTHYAQKEIASLKTFPTELNYESALVIPCYNENIKCIQNIIQNIQSHHKHLLVVVINQPEKIENSHTQRALFEYLILQGTLIWQQDSLSLVKGNGLFDFLLVNRFQNHKINEKQGVGLCRKIGADIVAALYDQKRINNNWFGSTDADVLLPANYFDVLSSLPKSEQASAIVLPFEHIQQDKSDIKIFQATQLYEKAIRYYVDGLKQAGSAYAFHTIGSIICLNVKDYCSVRGFPKRSAGEDFYLLNKLAKLSGVKTLKNTPIKIISRCSSRVPFGTGPMVKKILSQNSLEKFEYYHPMGFELLKQVLDFMKDLNVNETNIDMRTPLTDEALQCLNLIQFPQFLQKLQQQNLSQKQFQRQIQEWFDAFRTLKFLNILRDQFFGTLPLMQTLKSQKSSH